ncbi:Hypothetical protein NTJ_07164 [Nesidiocoris tenuis]|nr:Hypothetical protein NTJ_07164 [Nesidiocoris tenuis]
MARGAKAPEVFSRHHKSQRKRIDYRIGLSGISIRMASQRSTSRRVVTPKGVRLLIPRTLPAAPARVRESVPRSASILILVSLVWPDLGGPKAGSANSAVPFKRRNNKSRRPVPRIGAKGTLHI